MQKQYMKMSDVSKGFTNKQLDGLVLSMKSTFQRIFPREAELTVWYNSFQTFEASAISMSTKCPNIKRVLLALARKAVGLGVVAFQEVVVFDSLTKEVHGRFKNQNKKARDAIVLDIRDFVTRSEVGKVGANRREEHEKEKGRDHKEKDDYVSNPYRHESSTNLALAAFLGGVIFNIVVSHMLRKIYVQKMPHV
jgi:hypothetical protein